MLVCLPASSLQLFFNFLSTLFQCSSFSRPVPHNVKSYTHFLFLSAAFVVRQSSVDERPRQRYIRVCDSCLSAWNNWSPITRLTALTHSSWCVSTCSNKQRFIERKLRFTSYTHAHTQQQTCVFGVYHAVNLVLFWIIHQNHFDFIASFDVKLVCFLSHPDPFWFSSHNSSDHRMLTHCLILLLGARVCLDWRQVLAVFFCAPNFFR